MDPLTARPVQRLRLGEGQVSDLDMVVVEEPLEIRIGGRPFVVTMRTPGQDRELTAGLLATEQLVDADRDLVRIEAAATTDPDAEGNVIDVILDGEATFRWARARRHLLVNASCGICGKERIDQLRARMLPLGEDCSTIDFALLAELPGRLREGQSTFEQTGGLHAAGLFDLSGQLLDLAEDVGRHNAVDKVLGRAFLTSSWPLRERVLMVSGRSSFEIVQKAAVAGVPILASVSAPSSLAVDLASEVEMTLVGFLRDERANVYSRPERITGP